MTTTPTYNPIFRALRERTTPQALRWYLQQAKATAAHINTIATKAKHLLKPTSAKSAQASPEIAEVLQVSEAANQSEPIPVLDVEAEALAEAEVPTLSRFNRGNAEDERSDSVDEDEDKDEAIAQTQDTEVEAMPVPAGWNAIEADEDADSGFVAIADSDEELDRDAA